MEGSKRFRAVARHGFTLVEVLIAASVLMIALLGIAGMAANALRKSNMPDDVEKASLFAAERLEYFRTQVAPYQAAGGTYYPPPTDRFTPDLNVPGAGTPVNNVVNGSPYLFVREYLHDTSENRFTNDAGRTMQGDRFGANAINVIDPTPTQIDTNGDNRPDRTIHGILPNPGGRTLPNSTFNTTSQVANGVTYYFMEAPRANDGIRSGTTLPDTIKFVREVWIQTNLTSFPATMTSWPSGTQSFSAPSLDNLGGMSGFTPAPTANLPPFSIGVTVRVFARDPVTRDLRVQAGNPPDGIRWPGVGVSPPFGLGYDRRRPLATIVGYIGLRRRFAD